jgi:nucleoside-diphosphate-sugar epimerase
MKVFVAGAIRAIGSQLFPQLTAAGHDGIGMTPSPAKTDDLWSLGARPVVADALDPGAVTRAVAETEPEVLRGSEGASSAEDHRFAQEAGRFTSIVAARLAAG